MRAALLLLASAALAAGADLTPREGSGWKGFQRGAWIKTKRTSTMTGRTPAVTIHTQTLTEVGEKTLTITTESKNALEMVERGTVVVPVGGEAGVGEKETTETVGTETLKALGRELSCKHVRTKVTGGEITRTIDKWICDDPHVWVKRTETQRDGDGKETYASTWLIESIDARLTIAGREIACVSYGVKDRYATGEKRGVVHLSRDVPGGIALDEGEHFAKGASVMKYKFEVLDVGTE